MRYALGKLPARPGSVALKFGTFFDRKKLPVPPAVFGHETIGRSFGMLGNDKYSDCVWAGAAHETMVWARVGGAHIPSFTTTDVLADYSAATGFDVAKPDTDQGTDMQAAASYRRKIGIADAIGQRHKIDAYVAIKGWDDLMQAIYLLGAAGVGLNLPETCDDQFDAHQPWTYKKGTPFEGGHYVSGVGRNSAGRLLVVTWGRLQALDRDFFEACCDEAVAYLSLSVLRNKVTPEGFDEAGLRSAIAQLSA